ncbi:MAG: hypothetical protein AAFQ98_18420, partial [Bacteroidota bacterium]
WERSPSTVLLPGLTIQLTSGYQINERSEIFVQYRPYAELLYPSLGVLPQGIVSTGFRYYFP